MLVIFFLVGYFKPKGAGILIETNPSSTVFIDGIQVGVTPYEDIHKPGEVVLKLVPDSFDKPLAPYEAKVNLVSGVQTVVRRDFGEMPDGAAGETASFEKVGRNETSLSVVSIPDSAQVSIDGVVRAFAPYKTSAISQGEHELIVSAQGHQDRVIKVRTQNGYKLTIIVQLAPGGEPEVAGLDESLDSEVEEEEIEPQTFVVVGDTGVGFLRVRVEPSTLSEEIGRVTPGEKYVYIEEDEKTGWFKIIFAEGEEGLPAQSGWISSQYAELSEEEIATPSAQVEEES